MLVATATVVVAALSIVVGSLLGGPLGWGLACGGVLGAAIGATTSLQLCRVAREAPERVFNAFVVGFMVKLGVLMLSGLVFVAYEPLRQRLAPQSFLLACAGAALVGLCAGVAAARGELRDGARRSAPRS